MTNRKQDNPFAFIWNETAIIEKMKAVFFLLGNQNYHFHILKCMIKALMLEKKLMFINKIAIELFIITWYNKFK